MQASCSSRCSAAPAPNDSCALSACRRRTLAPWRQEQRLRQAPIPSSLSRRDMVATIGTSACILLSLPSSAHAAEAAAPAASVRPALSAGAYVDRILMARAGAKEQMLALIDMYSFKEAAEATVLAPFDDVAQSAFFLPWALLPVDEDRGRTGKHRGMAGPGPLGLMPYHTVAPRQPPRPALQVQAAYLAFEEKLIAFTKVCRAAASYRVEDEEVLAALDNMFAALDAELAVATA